jgi:hypothetical protein
MQSNSKLLSEFPFVDHGNPDNNLESLYYYYSVLEIVGLRVPARYIRDFALFNVYSSCKNCPSAICASAANVVCRDVDVRIWSQERSP